VPSADSKHPALSKHDLSQQSGLVSGGVLWVQAKVISFFGNQQNTFVFPSTTTSST
jgi:hypothetical protein